ncbi:MAG: DUF1553 domain-containing protein [Verrucomicrobiales bacterium]|nr:DUF1553 domain-containing protein [Verrucomicrobiales bacterium]
MMRSRWNSLRCLAVLLGLAASGVSSAGAATETKTEFDGWSLKPLAPPAVPAAPQGGNRHPIDALLLDAVQARGATPLPAADPAVWLRRVTFDLTGLPPTPEEQAAFLAHPTEEARREVVDRLLASPQHGVRYGRHWLDVLRYTDVDEGMPAAPGIHYWRDWVINALNQDLPYDQFVRAQVLGNRARQRRIISAAGHLTPVDPRPEDVFALGFLARGAASREDGDQQLAFSAVDTISSAFLGMTVGCARCHDHFYDPITQRDYYSMKSLFDPLMLRQVDLATPEQVFEQGRRVEEFERRLALAVSEMKAFIRPHFDRLYEERVSILPADVQVAIRKLETQRSAAEQKIYDDYYPVLRIDPPKIKELMKPEEIKIYDAHLKKVADLKPPEPLPTFFTVVEDAKRAAETNYVLTTGDPARPRKNHPVTSGFPFAPKDYDFRHGRREGLVDWMTSADNALFARVAVNRIWAWHFGSGLHPTLNDFGALGGKPLHPGLLDWLAAQFVAHGFSMKWLHREIVLTETYGRASTGEPSVLERNQAADPSNETLWRFPLRRLEAEPIRDAMLAAAGKLDCRLGGKSFAGDDTTAEANRRAAYMIRGYRTYAEIMPDYLMTFDVDDGRAVCPRRLETVTAPQSLFLMNSAFVDRVAGWMAEDLREREGASLIEALKLGYRRALARPPTDAELAGLTGALEDTTAGLKAFAWLLFNLDEFVYVR